MRIIDIAKARVRYGYKRIHVLLCREGWKVNHKAVYRIYFQEGLNLRYRQRRKKVEPDYLKWMLQESTSAGPWTLCQIHYLIVDGSEHLP